MEVRIQVGLEDEYTVDFSQSKVTGIDQLAALVNAALLAAGITGRVTAVTTIPGEKNARPSNA